ncbi:hypothetical protein ACSBR1_039929 [Camellia fascicularis]
MASFHHPLTLFLDLNDSRIKITSSFEPRQSTLAPAPILSFPALSVEQLMVAWSNLDANYYTLKSCVGTITARMYKDAYAEISNLKRQNEKLKWQATSAARFEAPSYSTFDGRRGVISFRSSANAGVESSKASRE